MGKYLVVRDLAEQTPTVHPLFKISRGGLEHSILAGHTVRSDFGATFQGPCMRPCPSKTGEMPIDGRKRPR